MGGRYKVFNLVHPLSYCFGSWESTRIFSIWLRFSKGWIRKSYVCFVSSVDDQIPKVTYQFLCSLLFKSCNSKRNPIQSLCFGIFVGSSELFFIFFLQKQSEIGYRIFETKKLLLGPVLANNSNENELWKCSLKISWTFFVYPSKLHQNWTVSCIQIFLEEGKFHWL